MPPEPSQACQAPRLQGHPPPFSLGCAGVPEGIQAQAVPASLLEDPVRLLFSISPSPSPWCGFSKEARVQKPYRAEPV